MANIKSKQKDPAYLKIIYDTIKNVDIFSTTNGYCKNLLENICRVFNTNIASLMLMDDNSKELFIEAACGLKEEVIQQTRLKIGQGIAGWVAKEVKPLLVKDINDCPQFKTKPYKVTTQYRTNSLMSAPLAIENNLLGVINVTDRKNKKSFNEGDLDLLITIANDSTNLIKIYRQGRELVKLSETKDKYISNLAHELKSPLATIKEGINLVVDRVFGEINEKQRHSLALSIENINRLTRMIDNLLNLSKIESGKITMKRQFIDLNELARKALDFFIPLANKKTIELNFPDDKDSIKIWADFDKIFQVVSNLLSNAIKYTSSGGNVVMNIKDEKNNALISVKDTGCGIPSEQIPKIFERYGTLSFRKDEAIDSNSLGLSITKEIVDLHRGKIEVESEIGKGSKFSVFLPKDLRT